MPFKKVCAALLYRQKQFVLQTLLKVIEIIPTYVKQKNGIKIAQELQIFIFF